MNPKINEITIDGNVYVPKNEQTEQVDSMPFVLVRGYASGVQFGYMKSRNGCEIELINSRRIWSWNGATETNQIAISGIDNSNSKVTVVVPYKIITDIIEVITLTKEASKSLSSTTIWKK